MYLWLEDGETNKAAGKKENKLRCLNQKGFASRSKCVKVLIKCFSKQSLNQNIQMGQYCGIVTYNSNQGLIDLWPS